MSTETECNPLAHGTPCWTYIPAHSVERARKFYGTLFDWTYRDNTEAYPAEQIAMVRVPDDRVTKLNISGGIVKVKDGETILTPHVKTGEQATVVFLWVNNVDEVLAKVEAAGGKILKPKEKEGGETGETATLMDTEGNAIGIYSMVNKD